MKQSRLLLGACALAGLLSVARPAAAGPTIITTRPTSTDTGKVEFLVGGIDESGRSLNGSALEVTLDGELATPSAVQSLSDWAAASSEASPTWKPPLAVGLVYLWVDGVPAGVLDGIHAFFQRIPSRTVVYPTIYGRLRQGRARLVAGDIGRLDEIPNLESYRPNMIDAVRLNLADLAADSAPLKILLLVTDGRDFADPKGEGPGDFAALGADLRRAGVTVLVARFRPEADAEQAATNLRDLGEATGGFLSPRDQPEELENTLESLGQSVADLQRVEVPTPWTWRFLGGSRRVAVRFTTAKGQPLRADVGTVTGGSALPRIIGAGLVGLSALVLLVLGIVKLRGGASRGHDDEGLDVDAVLTAAHNLIRRGASAERAVEELTRGNPEAGQVLTDLDESLLADPRFPYLRTRPGRKRMQEIRDLLRKRQGDRPGLPDTLARVLSEAVNDGLAAPAAAHKLAALTTSEERAAFIALDLEQLADALRSVAPSHPALGTPRARGVVVAIQDALQADESQASGVSVGWLVRAGGPGRRGETLRLQGDRTIIGRGTGCEIQLGSDPAVAPAHATIWAENGEFAVEPIGGAVKVEGEEVTEKRALVDGETLEIGRGSYVFKSASVLALKSGRSLGRG
ncbi:MAG TPA: FHA domain-containing protein [Polyangia bacterium]|nr:FHA domain-containing protein [Polyangia bacterium]